MRLWKKKRTAESVTVGERRASAGFSELARYQPLMRPENRLYDAIREAVPVVDAAIYKIVRLIGSCRLVADDASAQRALDGFCRDVKIGYGATGLAAFVSGYLESLLTYGNAVGEIVPTGGGDDVAMIMNASLQALEVERDDGTCSARIAVRDTDGLRYPERPDLLLFTALNPSPGEVTGNSLLKSLPFVTDVLMKILSATGANFERMGNLRFAVTYKPSSESGGAVVRDRVRDIAREWSQVMNTQDGHVRDFVCAGDVDIKVIGAELGAVDIQTPVRQMLEQIVAKTGLPPFLLGLSWSTTERMSKQQVDILTSELEVYRRLLTPVLLRIARVFLSLRGFANAPRVAWSVITLQDEVEGAQARLVRAQAIELERSLGIEHKEESYMTGELYE